MAIDSKDKFFQLYHKGVLGNKIKTWSYLDLTWETIHPSKLYVVRYAGHAGGSAFCAYNIRGHALPRYMVELRESGALPENIQISEQAPDDQIVFQGEMYRDHLGLYGRISDEKTQMRTALSNTTRVQHLRGLQLDHLLRCHCTPESYSDLMELLDLYPDHVVEFSVYSCHVGNCPRRNTLVWETRLY